MAVATTVDVGHSQRLEHMELEQLRNHSLALQGHHNRRSFRDVNGIRSASLEGDRHHIRRHKLKQLVHRNRMKIRVGTERDGKTCDRCSHNFQGGSIGHR